MSEELKPHMNDFLDISWFFMDALQAALRSRSSKISKWICFCPEAPVHPLGKITTLQKLCPLFHPLRDSLCRPVTHNKPGRAVAFHHLQQYLWFIKRLKAVLRRKKCFVSLKVEVFQSPRCSYQSNMTHSIRSEAFLWDSGSVVNTFWTRTVPSWSRVILSRNK